MITLDNPWKHSRMLKEIESEITENIVPIRPDISFDRKNNESNY